MLGRWGRSQSIPCAHPGCGRAAVDLRSCMCVALCVHSQHLGMHTVPSVLDSQT